MPATGTSASASAFHHLLRAHCAPQRVTAATLSLRHSPLELPLGKAPDALFRQPRASTATSAPNSAKAPATLLALSHVEASVRLVRAARKVAKGGGGAGVGALAGALGGALTLLDAQGEEGAAVLRLGFGEEGEEGEEEDMGCGGAEGAGAGAGAGAAARSVWAAARECEAFTFPFAAAQVGNAQLLWWAGPPLQVPSLLAHGAVTPQGALVLGACGSGLFPPGLLAAAGAAGVEVCSEGGAGEGGGGGALLFSPSPRHALRAARAAFAPARGAPSAPPQPLVLALYEVACGVEHCVVLSKCEGGEGVPRAPPEGAHSVVVHATATSQYTAGVAARTPWGFGGAGGGAEGQDAGLPAPSVLEGAADMEHCVLVPEEQARLRYLVIAQ